MVARVLVLCILAAALTAGQGPTQEVAFSTGLSHHQSLSPGDVVKYDRIMTNVGSAYDPTTGVFTCSVAGTYVFQFHGLSRQDSELYLELYQNDQYVASAYGHTLNDYASAGNSAILNLSAGDKVTVKAGDTGSTVDLYGAAWEVYSTFSGFLIEST